VGHDTSTRRGEARRRGEGEGDAARRDHATDGGRLSCSPPTLPPFSGRLPPPHASPPPPHPSSNPIHKTHRQSITKTRGPLLGARQTRNGSPLRLSPVLLPRPKIRSNEESPAGKNRAYIRQINKGSSRPEAQEVRTMPSPSSPFPHVFSLFRIACWFTSVCSSQSSSFVDTIHARLFILVD